MEVRLEAFCEAGMDEQWSSVGKESAVGKESEQCWLWYAIDHAARTILAYVFGKRKDDVFKQLKALLKPRSALPVITPMIGAPASVIWTPAS